MMEEYRPQLPLGAFWYGVVFLAGVYYGITFVSGGMKLAVLIIASPVLCILMAVAAINRWGRRTLLAAGTLYVNFFSFSIGYGIAGAGIVRFGYHGHHVQTSRSESRTEVVDFANRVQLGETQRDVHKTFQDHRYKTAKLIGSKPNLWAVRTPFELFGNNWGFFIQFSQNYVTAVRVRTERDINTVPVGAPADRLSPGQDRKFPEAP